VSASTEAARHIAPAKSRILLVQLPNIADTSVDDFRNGNGQTVIWSDRYKAGDVILPYSSVMHTGRSSARFIAIEEPTGASCSHATAAASITSTVRRMAPAAENARYGETHDGDIQGFNPKSVGRGTQCAIAPRRRRLDCRVGD
jgi:hypothetical protein